MTRRVRGLTTDLHVDLGPPGRWSRSASCSGMADDLLDFFGKSRAEWALSKQVCKRCPVRRACLEYALESRNVHGVWGMRDPLELRFALGRDASGSGWTYTRSDVKCLYCRSETGIVRLDGETVTRTCETCGLSWERYEREKPKRRRRTARLAVELPSP